MRNRINTLVEQNLILEQEQVRLNNLIVQREVQYNKVLKTNKELHDLSNYLNNQKIKHNDKIYREKNNKKKLEILAIQKTELVQKILNEATKNVFNCFEKISKNEKCVR